MLSYLELFRFLDLFFQHSGINFWEPKANNIYTATNFSQEACVEEGEEAGEEGKGQDEGGEGAQ